MGETADRRSLLVLGAGGFAVEVADLAEDVGMKVAGFVEGLDRQRCEHQLDGRPVYWVDQLPGLAADHVFVCGVGDPAAREMLVASADAAGVSFTTLVHPTAHVSRRATIGLGTIVSPGVVVAVHAAIGRHVIVNRGAMVGHHTRLGDFVSLMTGGNIAGSSEVGDRVYVGMGALVLNGLKVGNGATVAAGAVVTRDVEAGSQVRGLPARAVVQDSSS